MLRFIAENNNWKSPKAAEWEEFGLKGYNFVIELEKAWKNAGRYYAYGFQAKHQNTALVHLERAYRLLSSVHDSKYETVEMTTEKLTADIIRHSEMPVGCDLCSVMYELAKACTVCFVME